MVLQSPIYKAPSISKMGKKSSPLNSSSQKIESAVKAPKLKSSKMSFVKGLGESFIKPESLKGPDTSEVEGLSSIASTLTETNSILVEIQKQLALDFSNRIAERKNELAEEKSKIRAQKLSKKEQFVEKSKGLGSGITKFASKALAPVKGIFDKILEFLTIVGTGMLINSIWTWLQDKENRDKVIEVFAFLKTYWKEIFFTILTLAVVKKLISLITFVDRLRKLFNLFRGNTPRGGGKLPPGGCGPVLSCAPQLATAIVAALSAAALALLGKKLVDSGTVAKPIPPEQPIGQPPVVNEPIIDPVNEPVIDPTPKPTPKPRYGAKPDEDPFSIPPGVLAGLLTAAGVGALFAPVIGGRPLAAVLLGSAGKLTIAAMAAAILANSTLSPSGAAASELSSQKSVEEGINKYNNTDKDELVKLYKNEDAPLAERMAAESILKEKHGVLEPQKLSRGGIVPGMPSMQDTVHALLAKGEFVINSMSTKMFKPFLYAMNNNAGRLFKQFIEGVNLMKKNNELSEELTKIQFVMVKKLNTQVEELVEREKEKKRKELERRNPTGGGGGMRHPNSGGSNQSLIETKPQEVPVRIQTYRRGISRSSETNDNNSNSAEGKTSVVQFNVTQPAIQLAGQETPEPVPTESSERSQTSITISSTDSSNPYIVSSYVNYGIDV